MEAEYQNVEAQRQNKVKEIETQESKKIVLTKNQITDSTVEV
jgi:hypothetical protein